MQYVTHILIIVNIIVFLLIFSMPEDLANQTLGLFSISQGTALQFWRFITAMFLHASASHLFFNMLGLFFFGRILEKEVESKYFLMIYFVTGILGSAVFLLTSPAAAIGASGAVFGVMGAAMLLNPLGKVYLYVIPLPLGIVAITFLVFETLVVYFQPAEFSNVANIAHLGGLATGALFAFYSDPQKSMKGILVLLICGALLVFLGPIFSLIGGIGGIILNVIDNMVGFFLYGAAHLLSFLWV